MVQRNACLKSVHNSLRAMVAVLAIALVLFLPLAQIITLAEEEPYIQEGEAGYGVIYEDPDNELASYCEWYVSLSVNTRTIEETQKYLACELGYNPIYNLEPGSKIVFYLLNGRLVFTANDEMRITDIISEPEVVPGGFYYHWDIKNYLLVDSERNEIDLSYIADMVHKGSIYRNYLKGRFESLPTIPAD